MKIKWLELKGYDFSNGFSERVKKLGYRKERNSDFYYKPYKYGFIFKIASGEMLCCKKDGAWDYRDFYVNTDNVSDIKKFEDKLKKKISSKKFRDKVQDFNENEEFGLNPTPIRGECI